MADADGVAVGWRPHHPSDAERAAGAGDILAARIRASASLGPPAANGTTMVMGCEGKLSATALPLKASSAANMARIAFRITPSDSAHTIVIARSQRVPPSAGPMINSAPKQSSFLSRGAMDCFAEPVIGRRFAPTRWLAMTVYSVA
jgi:hypothetical protein